MTTASRRVSPSWSASQCRWVVSRSSMVVLSLTSMARALPSSRTTTRSISWSPLRVRRWPTVASAAWAGTRTHSVARDSKRWPEQGAGLGADGRAVAVEERGEVRPEQPGGQGGVGQVVLGCLSEPGQGVARSAPMRAPGRAATAGSGRRGRRWRCCGRACRTGRGSRRRAGASSWRSSRSPRRRHAARPAWPRACGPPGPARARRGRRRCAGRSRAGTSALAGQPAQAGEPGGEDLLGVVGQPQVARPVERGPPPGEQGRAG